MIDWTALFLGAIVAVIVADLFSPMWVFFKTLIHRLAQRAYSALRVMCFAPTELARIYLSEKSQKSCFSAKLAEFILRLFFDIEKESDDEKEEE